MYKNKIHVQYKETSSHKPKCVHCNRIIPKGEPHVKISLFAYRWVNEFTCKKCFKKLNDKLLEHMCEVDTVMIKMRKIND